MACGCKELISRLRRGAVGLGKAVAGLDAADEPTIQARRDQCRRCEHATRNPNPKYAANTGLTTFSRCTKCSCYIAPKTKIASEMCPIGRWAAVAAPAPVG